LTRFGLIVFLLALGCVPAVPTWGDEDRLGRLEAQLAERPHDLETRFAFAQALSWEGRWDEALAQYDRLLTVAPDDPDYLLGKAQVLAWMGRPGEALPLLDTARVRAPDYEAVLRLQSQVRAQLAAGPAQELGVGLEWQHLDGGLPDWTSRFVNYRRRLDAGRILSAGLRRTERFGLADTEGGLGVAFPLAEIWLLSLEGRLAPGADVLPRWAGHARLRRDLPEGWGVEAGLRRAGYADSELTIVALGTERYFGRWFAAWTLFAGRLQGADTTWSNSLRVDHYYAETSRIGLMISAGRETDSLGDGRFTTNAVRGAALIGQHQFSRSWGLGWEVLVHEQGDAYTRRGIHVGVRHQF
jgi:YaiO family outer membrane protein